MMLAFQQVVPVRFGEASRPLECKPMISSSRKGAAPPPPPGVGVKMTTPSPTSQGSDTTTDITQNNGSGPPSLTYSTEPEDDENMNEVGEETIVELVVMLPSGKPSHMEVDANIPMIDLLVHLAGRAKLNPAGHKLVVVSEETGRTVEYKANQSVGSLGITTIHLVDKKAVSEKNKKNVHMNPVTKQEQPFEMTYRLTINLPRNQKSVIRINPKVQLHQLFRTVCDDKNLDPARFTFQHPAKPDHPLDPHMTVGDLNSNEIYLVPASLTKAKRSRSFLAPVPDQAQSMPDLRRSESSRVAPQEQPMPTYMPGAGSEKKKSRIFSFFKKEKKYKPHGASFAETPPASSPPRRSGSPPTKRSTETKTKTKERPKTMYAGMPTEENGHIQMRSPSNGQLPQGIEETPKSSQTLDRPPKKLMSASPPGPTGGGEVASHTLPRPAAAVKSPPRGHGKKRQAPPPPQQTPSPAQNSSLPQQQQQQSPSLAKAPSPSATVSSQIPPSQTPTSPPQPSSASSVQGSPVQSPNTASELPKTESVSVAKGAAAEQSSKPDVEVTVARKDSAEADRAVSDAHTTPKHNAVVTAVPGEISVSVETDASNKRHHEHSRTSSDSSGYHEAEATLSGPESPEANRPTSSLHYNKDNSMDSASIESTENATPEAPAKETPVPHAGALNIPSLRSQMRNRDAELDSHVIPGEFATLPRHHVDKKAKEQKQAKEGVQRTHSLEKESKSAPQKRRKAPAPPPPAATTGENVKESPVKVEPNTQSPPSISTTTTTTPPQDDRSERNVSPREISASSEREERSAKVNGHEGKPERSSERMQVPVADISSDPDAATGEITASTNEGSRPSRTEPPLFIPPPPPDTPPPPDSRYQNASLQTEEKTSEEEEPVLTEEAGLNSSLTSEGAELNSSLTADSIGSLKSSPSSTQSRTESRASKTSVSTIEEVNLAFDETIALAEEVLGNSCEEAEENEKISSRSSSLDQRSPKTYHRRNNPEEESPRRQQAVYDDREALPNRAAESRSINVNVDSSRNSYLRNSASDDVVHAEEVLGQSEQSVSEITYDFKVDAVPPAFTGENIKRQSTSEEEEEMTIIEEEIVFTGPSELIQRYKDDAEQDIEIQQREERKANFARNEVPGATVPNWDTTSQEPAEPEDSIVHAKMVMVEPAVKAEPRDKRTPVSLSSTADRDVARQTDHPVEKSTKVSVNHEQKDTKEVVANGSAVDARRDTILRYVRDEARAKARREPEVPRQKEEFVFSKADLNKLDFLGGRKPKKTFIRTGTPVSGNTGVGSVSLTTNSSSHVVETPSYLSQPQHVQVTAKPSKAYMVPQPYRQPSVYSTDVNHGSQQRSTAGSSYGQSGLSRAAKTNVNSLRSDLNFPPTTESEAENVLEEKSISMIALPAMRVSSSDQRTRSVSSPESSRPSPNVTSVSSVRLSEKPRSASDTTTTTASSIRQNRHHAAVEAHNQHNTDTNATTTTTTTEQQDLVNSQYDQLQTQFSMWQQQLAQNQALLAQHKIMPEDQSQQLQQLKMQLQLQQQMMEQLQQSMQALAMQGAVVTPQPVIQPAAPAPVVNSAPVASSNIPSAPAPPPPAPSLPAAVAKAETKTTTKAKNKKRFERQLDPREELMLAIRQASGRNCLKKVTVKEARWTNRPTGGEH